jgi:hypothetical protein
MQGPGNRPILPGCAISSPDATRKPQTRTINRKPAFLRAFRLCGSIRDAARYAGIRRTAHYEWLAADAGYRDRFFAAKTTFAKGAEAAAYRRAVQGAIIIGDWQPHLQHSRKSLRGFFSVRLFNGLTIRRLELHERGGKRSVRLPRRQWIDLHGRKELVRPVEFVRNRAAARDFAGDVLAALDKQLKDKAK